MANVVAIAEGGAYVDADKAADPIRENLRRSREAQKAFHATWQSNLAFASGQHWLVWSEKDRTLRSISQMDPRYRNRELYTADVITENRLAVLGEMGSDDDRPELLLRRNDISAEDFQAQVNRAVGYGWDHEWHGDEVLAEVDRLTIDLGTAAVRCRFDPTVGKVAYKDVPHANGQPMPREEAIKAAEAAVLGVGERPEYRDVPEGRICWEPIPAFGLLPPVGVAHERYFPFDCIVRPTLLSDVKAIFGAVADELREDGDIGSTLGEPVVGAPGAGADRMKNRLRGYIWLFTYFERPAAKTPQGRVFYFGGNKLKLLDVKNTLPYVAPDGTYRAGISYFHWWRVTGRFFSRSLIEALKDGQRAKNKRRTQANEIVDKGMPKYFGRVGSTARARTNEVMEKIELQHGEEPPTIFPGFGPGDWMYREDEQIDKDLARSTGITAPTLGENPASVTNYSQLSLLREQSQVKRQPVYIERKLAIARLVEDSVYDIRTYWGAEKQIMLAGEDDRVDAENFNATKIPSFFIVRVAKGAAKPRSQAGELQKVQDIWTAATAAGAVMRDPDSWVLWFKASLEHGQALDLPDSPADDQAQKAEFENHLMLAGIEVEPRYYDPPEVHVPRHRQAQIQADQVGDIAAWERIERHVQATLALAQQMSAALQSNAPPTQEAQAGQAAGAPPLSPSGAPAPPQ